MIEAIKRLINDAIIIIIQVPKKGSRVPLSQSEALGRYPLARSQLTLGTRRKDRIELREEY